MILLHMGRLPVVSSVRTSTCAINPQDHNLTADQTKTLVVADAEVLSSKIDNLINLNDLTEEAILHNLRIRFKVRWSRESRQQLLY